jgi:protein-disulfide isomerase-like protein with CxxC motif
MVDSAVIVAAVVALWIHHEISSEPLDEAWLAAFARPRIAVLWLAGAAVVGVLPVIWGEYPVVPPLPPGIEALSVPGKLTIVTFTDFQCPYCRGLHPVLRDVEAGAGGRAVLIRKMVPLPGHPGAEPAARAYVCTPSGRREEMAEALYTAEEDRLTAEGMRAIAAQLHLDAAAFARCVDAPETTATIEADIELFKAIDGQGLPTAYIGPRVVIGFNPANVEKFTRLGLAGPRPSLPVAWMLAVALAVALGITAVTARLARNPAAS